jgi:hypothetical protein
MYVDIYIVPNIYNDSLFEYSLVDTHLLPMLSIS